MVCVVSINIRFDNPTDGRNRWGLRLPLLSGMLNAHRPDIIATQEGWRDQLQELEARLAGCSLVDRHRGWLGDRMYPCLFVRRRRLRVLRSGDVWLSETPDVAGSYSFGSAFPRLMTWCELELHASGRRIVFANLHLDHERRSTRIEQARVAARELYALNERRLPVILAGDFNDTADGPVRAAVMDALPELYDPWEAAGKSELPTFHGFNGRLPEAERIDWILLDRRLTAGEIFIDRRSRQGRYPSDHFPVVCRLEI